MSVPTKRRAVHLVRYLDKKENPTPEAFKLVEEDLPEPSAGFGLLKVLELSPDPYLRSRMSGGPNYSGTYELNKAVHGFGVAKIIKTGGGETNGFKEGDIVQGWTIPWADYGIIELTTKLMRKLLPGEDQVKALSTSGMVALTAYFGIVKYLPFKDGDKKTLVITGGAGAVGQIVYYIARLKKAFRIVGIAGSQEKLDFMKKIGYDDVVSYKSKTFEEDFKKAVPDGVDFYWDNVGGTTSKLVISKANLHANILVCGSISGYNGEEHDSPLEWFDVVRRRLHLNGMLVFDWFDEWDGALKELVGWEKEGKIKCETTRSNGLEQAVEAWIGLFKGDNIGKALVKVATE